MIFTMQRVCNYCMIELPQTKPTSGDGMFDKVSFFDTLDALHVEIKSGNYLLLVGEKSDLSHLHALSSITMIGAIFPRVIFGTQSFESGIVALKLSDKASFHLLKDMDKVGVLPMTKDVHSVFAVVDGLSSKLDDFLENIFFVLPEQTYIMGGGAGKMTLKQEPVIFDNHGFYQDSAFVIQSSSSMNIGVGHGWEPLLGPFLATDCNGHTLEKINFKEAFHMYKSAVEKDTPERFNETNFFDIAKSYPIGILRCGRDPIVRNPIFSDGKSLSLIGNMDTNSVISILKGSKETLIQAAKQAALAANEHTTSKSYNVILVDCISRLLFLKESFQEELEAIKLVYPNEIVMWGMLTLGEIANANQEGIEFYNQTCVVGTL